MQPKLILAVIAGGASGVFTFNILGAGLVAAASPGSIFAVMAMAAKGSWFAVFAGVVVSTIVTFLVASVLIDRNTSEKGLDSAKQKSKDMKVKKDDGSGEEISLDSVPDVDLSNVKSVAVACDAGMGSSAMGASKCKAEFKKAGLTNVKVANYSIENIPADTDVIITHKSLASRAAADKPFGLHLAISDFITTGIYKELAAKVSENSSNNKSVTETGEQAVAAEPAEEVTEGSNQTLTRNNIRIGLETVPKVEAIKMAGQILFEAGYVEEEYIDAMVQRDSELSTFIGNGTAIPHGVSDAKKKIKKTGISILQFPDGVDFDGNTVYLVVGIAGVGNEHLMILANLAEIVEDEEKVEQIRTTNDVDYIYKLFTSK